MLDLTKPSVIKDLMQTFDTNFSKGLGQNFLINPAVLDSIAEAAECDGEGVIEVGPGIGVLTAQLAQRAKKVVSVEIDSRLIDILNHTLADFDNVKIVNDDILKLNLPKLIQDEFDASLPVSVAANLPYYITTPILTMLLESGIPFKNIVIMVQKEVGMRICASPGGKDYGALTVLCNFYSEPEIVTHVPAGNFMPAPKVDSVVVKLKMRKESPVLLNDTKLFFTVVKAAFAQRRKTLENCLANFPGLNLSKQDAHNLLLKAGIEPGIRGERLSINEFAAIANLI